MQIKTFAVNDGEADFDLGTSLFRSELNHLFPNTYLFPIVKTPWGVKLYVVEIQVRHSLYRPTHPDLESESNLWTNTMQS